MSKVSKVSLDKKEMQSQYHAGIFDFWFGVFILGLVFEPLGWYRTHKAIKIAEKHGWEVTTGLATYHALTVILTLLQILFGILFVAGIAAES